MGGKVKRPYLCSGPDQNQNPLSLLIIKGKCLRVQNMTVPTFGLKCFAFLFACLFHSSSNFYAPVELSVVDLMTTLCLTFPFSALKDDSHKQIMTLSLIKACIYEGQS